MKLDILAHPPNPKPTTSTHTTINAFNTYMAVQLGRKTGGFSTAFCICNNETNNFTRLVKDATA
jgi:hypothetical protein